MTSQTSSTQRPRHAHAARLLSLALLVLITFSATTEVVHKHGNLTIGRTTTAQTAVSIDGGAGSSLKDSRSIADCLICQLQQNLSTTLFSQLPQAVAPLAEAVSPAAAEISYLSQSDTPRRGRAPPLTSLN